MTCAMTFATFPDFLMMSEQYSGVHRFVRAVIENEIRLDIYNSFLITLPSVRSVDHHQF
jgi:hypothetical protein